MYYPWDCPVNERGNHPCHNGYPCDICRRFECELVHIDFPQRREWLDVEVNTHQESLIDITSIKAIAEYWGLTPDKTGYIYTDRNTGRVVKACLNYQERIITLSYYQ